MERDNHQDDLGDKEENKEGEEEEGDDSMILRWLAQCRSVSPDEPETQGAAALSPGPEANICCNKSILY